MMNSGDLKHRIEWQAQTRTADNGGGFNVTWSAVCTTWASLWPLKAAEAVQGDRTVATATHRIRIRFRRPFKASWRGRDLFSGNYYNIVSAPLDLGDNHQFLELMVQEVTT